MVALDDLQWADPSSLLTLSALGSRQGDVPVALIGCLRLLPRSPELTGALEALDAGGARRLPLGPLGEEIVAQVVEEVVAAEPGRRLLLGRRGRAATRCSSPSWWARSSRTARSRSPTGGLRRPR